MNVLFIESDQNVEYNSANWRCVMPARALNRAGHPAAIMRVEEFMQASEASNKLVEAADIVVIQRNMFDMVNVRALYWKSRGKPIVVDLDDGYKFMTAETGSMTHEMWATGVFTDKDGNKHQTYPKPMEQLEYAVKLVGAMSSPSKLICQDWEPMARTYWFPNYLDLSLYRLGEFYKEPGKIYLGWGGAATHLVSWTGSGANKAVEQICREYPNVNLILIGDTRVERFFDIPKTQRLAIGWIPHGVFASRLNQIDIGLIPMYGEYDRRRSWIKSAEYSVLGIPWIGSEMEPTDSIATGSRVQNTTEDWYRALKFYVENFGAVREAAQKSIPAARDFFDIDNPANSMIPTFERIIKESK